MVGVSISVDNVHDFWRAWCKYGNLLNWRESFNAFEGSKVGACGSDALVARYFCVVNLARAEYHSHSRLQRYRM